MKFKSWGPSFGNDQINADSLFAHAKKEVVGIKYPLCSNRGK